MTAEPSIAWGADVAQDEFDRAAPDATDRDRAGADAEPALVVAGGVPAARLATYVREDLHGAPGTTGVIGHYAARDPAAGVALLRAAAARLRARGAARVLGPMNGSTWARYRFALHDEGAPAGQPFLGEPVNPPDYPRQFAAAGFRELARYESRIATDVATSNPRAAAAEIAAAERGVIVRQLDLARFDDELRDLHALSTRAFAGNLFYSPIAPASFQAMYRPLRAMLDPAFVLLARAADDRLVGYAFAYPDPLDLVEGRPWRLIVKTLAVDPDWRSFGLGALLVERLHAEARAKQLTAVIHALMHVANNSLRISAHTADVFRRYALYEHA